MSNDALNEFIKVMTETLKQAKDFTLAQAPEVMKEIIHFSIAEAIVGIVLGAGLLAGAYRIHLHIQNKLKADKWSSWDAAYILVVFMVVFGAITLCCNGDSILQLTFAPRMYLINYFGHLVRN